AQPQDERAAIARQTALRTLVPFLALIPFFGVLLWVGAGWALAPLDAMSKAVAKRRPDALEPLEAGPLPTELQPLARNLNDLLARLDHALSSQRRFTADAAHELRTPLAALTLQRDLARRAQTRNDVTAALVDLEAGVQRASHVVEQLMTLARVEPEAMAQKRTACDLVAIAKDAIVARAALAADKHIDLGLARETPAIVMGDPTSLGILLSNLLDNALRYTPQGGRIDVTIDRSDDAITLAVADTGPGIPPEARERVFDRFFRGEEQAGSAAGTGLGLSIVKRIVEAHGAAVDLGAPAQGSGLVVSVRFPIP
ncbi:MAG TPA: ATP-binding protein, partial [Casimicrobiaceae bacterium]